MEETKRFRIKTTDIMDGQYVVYPGCTNINVPPSSLLISFNNNAGKFVGISGVPFVVEEE